MSGLQLMNVWLAVCALLVSSGSESVSARPPADLILSGGRVFTAEARTPWAEAVAIRGERIVFVGSTQEALGLKGPKTEVMDLSGRLILPGFNDSHIHLVNGALSFERVDLIEDQSLEAVQKRIHDFAKANPKSPWVLGRGWVYGSFRGSLPTKEQLDAVVLDRPAYMECYDGHSGWANSKALALAGIAKDTKDPEGGVIVRDPRTGEPTGALKEAPARQLVESKIPLPDADGRYRLLVRALALLSSYGITSVQDARWDGGDLAEDAALYERAQREGRLSVRVRAAAWLIPGGETETIALARLLKETHTGPILRFGTVKAFVDGVVEAHTAAMLAPYSDDPSFGLGLPNWDAEALKAAVVAADKAGLQVYLHAIGDRGVRMALDAHEAAIRVNGPRDRRGRIEHIETIDTADYPRFAKLGVIASMQPFHANPDQNLFDVWARNLGPERASRGFSWRAIEKAGGKLVFGSDWPIVTPDVLRGLYCAVSRKTREGTPADGWLPAHAVSLESAMRHYTLDGAFASFEEAEKGSITVGKLADLVVVSEDVFKGPPERLLTAHVLLTLVGGRVVHRAAGF